ncbi:MAG: flagellar type III secretion system protein FliR [Rhodospirillales bacterium]|nr:flagellar type III secretion system protein FliR [Rhodospirillales bacterium]
MSLADILPATAFPVLLVFARVGSAMMVLPGIGDLYVPQRWRLLLAMALAGIVAGVVGPSLPALPASPATLLALLFGEIVVGLFLGTVARLLLAALETAGQIVSLQLGLSAATVFNPAAAQQGAITGAFLMMLGTLLVLLTDAHHLMIRAVVDSYALFTPGSASAFGDFAEAMSKLVSGTFRLAVELSAPLILVGVVFYTALGLVSRLMPQLQIFFIVVPIQIVGGVFVFAVTLAAVMRWFHQAFLDGISLYVTP